MSKELIERLRDPQNVDIGYYWNLADEAADEIDRLTADLDRRKTIHKEDFDKLAGYVKAYPELEAKNKRLTAELAELRNSMGFRTSLIGRLETELAALKAQSEPVGTVVLIEDPKSYSRTPRMIREVELDVELPEGTKLYTTPQPAQDQDAERYR